MQKIGYMLIQVLRYVFYLSIAALLNLMSSRSNTSQISDPVKTDKIAIHFHVFHLELAQPILNAIAALIQQSTTKIKVFVTTTMEKEIELLPMVKSSIPSAEIFAFENLGRDVLPYLKLAKDGRFKNSTIVIKVHTKANRRTPQGDVLNDQIALDLLNPNLVNDFLSANTPRPFIATYSDHIFGWRYLGRNTTKVLKLLVATKAKTVPWIPEFPAASMFWVSSSLTSYVDGLDLTDLNFPQEPIASDGTLAHAFERFYGLYALASGAVFLKLDDVPKSEANNAD